MTCVCMLSLEWQVINRLYHYRTYATIMWFVNRSTTYDDYLSHFWLGSRRGNRLISSSLRKKTIYYLISCIIVCTSINVVLYLFFLFFANYFTTLIKSSERGGGGVGMSLQLTNEIYFIKSVIL